MLAGMGMQVSFGFGNFRLILRAPEAHTTGGGTYEGQLTEAPGGYPRVGGSAGSCTRGGIHAAEQLPLAPSLRNAVRNLHGDRRPDQGPDPEPYRG
jgi:hypothetical protein